ncbi:MAG: phosphoglycerate dehydrogenase [Acidobacteriota bacterium]
MYKILVSDPLEATGLAMLRDAGHEVTELPGEERHRLPEIIGEYDALVVRSGTKVTADLLRAGKRLRVVGRAGIGVDNVDIDAATELGILVVNAPTANLISATEHTFALMLALARNVSIADSDVKSGAWNRKKWVGTELQGKTLGVVGFGRIGQQVARRARVFDMKVLAYDPFLDADVVRRHEAEPRALDDLLAESDVITLHVPMTAETRGLLDADRIARLKSGALIVNCARGGVIEEAPLLAALEEGRIAGAALDVFAVEPPEDFTLAKHPRVVATPHLGAQTREAQVRISTETAKMVVKALDGSLAVTAVNLPFRPAGLTGEPFLRLAEKLGSLTSNLFDGSVKQLTVELRGVDDELQVPITVAALKGALARHQGESVNYVNAERIAAARGVDIVRATSSELVDYPNLIAVRLTGTEGTVEAAGTLFYNRDARIVRLAGYDLEFRPKGSLLVVRNRDVPGVVGKLGTALGEAGVNIAEIHLSRRSGSDEALSVARLDQRPPQEFLASLRQLEEVVTADLVDVGQL